jgi:pyruvate/2-oxoglutarate dehydrogenase complex dihydrolipoamide acyltransferase (E2) component
MQDVVPVLVPHETVNDDSVKLTAWFVRSGERVSAEQLLGQVETSKALLDIHAPSDGFVRYEYGPGSEVAVGAALCYITSTSDTPLPQDAFQPAVSVPQKTAKSSESRPAVAAKARRSVAPQTAPSRTFSPRFSRSAENLLREHKLDAREFAHLALVKADDILAFLEKVNGHATAADDQRPAVDGSKAGASAGVPLHWEELSRRKLGEIRYLRSAQQNALASSVTVSCPTRGLRSMLRAAGGAISAPTPIFVFEAARLLRNYPAFNAVWAGGRVGYYDEVNIGVAMDYDKGLLVPIVRNADQKELATIAEELWGFMYKYMRQELTAEDLSGGTFVVSDLSAEGVLSFAPLVNQGQSAILGIGSEVFPVPDAPGSFNLILTFDHQLAEGRMAARFLNELAERIQAHEVSLNNSQNLAEQEKTNT